MQAEVEAEDLLCTFRELLRNGIEVPRFIGLTIRGREDQPVVGNANEAQVDIGTVGRASDDPLIPLAPPEQQGDQGIVYGDRAPAALALWHLELEPVLLGVREGLLDLQHLGSRVKVGPTQSE